jgi:hypothetical protein
MEISVQLAATHAGVKNVTVNLTSMKVTILTTKGIVSGSHKREVKEYNLL